MKKTLLSLTALASVFVTAKAQIGPCSGTPVPVITAQYAPACAGHNDTIYANPFLTKGLVAYYPFNGNANDLSGNGYNATTVGVSLATDRFGNPNKCYNFAGTSTYVQCPSATYF
jgi:hydrogenase maturation factor